MIQAAKILAMVDFKKRSDIHLARKIWHMSAVGVMALAYAYLPERVSLTLLVAVALLFIPFDFLRFRYRALNDLLLHIFKPIMRDHEVNSVAGTTYLLSGVLLTAFIFPRDIVLLTLLFLAFADPIASYFGIKFGKDKIFGDKSLQGSLAAFIVCMVLAYLFFYTHGLFLDRIIIISAIAGFIGAFAEAFPVWKLDDNFSLPVLSAILLWIVFYFFGALPMTAIS